MLTLLHYTQTCASLPSGTKQVVLKLAQEKDQNVTSGPLA